MTHSHIHNEIFAVLPPVPNQQVPIFKIFIVVYYDLSKTQELLLRHLCNLQILGELICGVLYEKSQHCQKIDFGKNAKM